MTLPGCMGEMAGSTSPTNELGANISERSSSEPSSLIRSEQISLNLMDLSSPEISESAPGSVVLSSPGAGEVDPLVGALVSPVTMLTPGFCTGFFESKCACLVRACSLSLAKLGKVNVCGIPATNFFSLRGR